MIGFIIALAATNIITLTFLIVIIQDSRKMYKFIIDEQNKEWLETLEKTGCKVIKL